jgi:hypothetical protein
MVRITITIPKDIIQELRANKEERGVPISKQLVLAYLKQRKGSE